jgi:rhodanese-related sulfurtransferase
MHFVDCETLARWLLEHPARVHVVDLRDRDFATGRIRGSRHVPFSALDVDSLISGVPQGATDVVLHCHYSQMRGPSAATAVEAVLAERYGSVPNGGSGHGANGSSPRLSHKPTELWEAGEGEAPFRVSILRGGFDAWHELYHANPLLYESLSSRSSREHLAAP